MALTTPPTMTPFGSAILDDASALRRFAATGDPRAFETLVHRYQAMVLATCKRTLRNDTDAEDATQEAFLRLAQHAGTITSNAAAWLHACAVRSSLDLLRKKDSAARAEQNAGVLGTVAVEGAEPPEADWRDIEPILDAAVAKLSEADRALIVGRFLAGRPQTEMAREAGVNPGTMHRRIEKALDRLRAHLQASGLSVAAPLGAMLTAGLVGTQVSQALTGSLVKVGLTGLTRRPPSGSSGLVSGVLHSSAGKVAVASVATLIGIVAISGGAMMMRGANASGGSFFGASASNWRAVSRPKLASPRYTMTSNLAAGLPNGVMRCSGDTIVIDSSEFDDESPAGPRVKTVLKIVDSRRSGGVDKLTLLVESTGYASDHPLTQRIGQTFEATYRLEGTLVHLYAKLSEEPGDDIAWFGCRPPQDNPIAANAVEDNPLVPGLGGLWFEVEPYALELTEKDILITWEKWRVHRFRVLDWKEAKGQTRVQAICADSMNPSMVGDQVKLLLREDDAGFTIAMHNQYSDKLNEWPPGFAIAPEVTIMTFRKGTP